MESEGNLKPSNPGNPATAPNPPSVEAAYKRKCIALKKRLNEIEAQNDAMRIRNAQGQRYIQKMRLESCILLERLALLTGMSDERGSGPAPNPELRARAMAMMEEPGSLFADNNGASNSNNNAGTNTAVKRGSNGVEPFDDVSDGSSEGHPPTPQERPLRVKRNRRADDTPSSSNDATVRKAGGHASSTLPPLLPAIRPRSPVPGHSRLEPAHMMPYTPTAPFASNAGSPANYQTVPYEASPNSARSSHHYSRLSNGYNNNNNNPPAPPPASDQPQQQQQQQPQLAPRYVSAFENFTNQNRTRVVNALLEAYGPDTQVTEEDIDRALADHWESLDPSVKRTFGEPQNSAN